MYHSLSLGHTEAQLALTHSRKMHGRFHHVTPTGRLLQEGLSGRLAGS